jgi:ADP-ribose pyrophosphatase YjhB (NUDIX family)
MALLVSCGTDSTGGDFARPLGRSVEFGERAVDAVRREICEELGSAFEPPTLLGVTENRFKLDGVGHEVIFAFVGTLADVTLYDRSEMPILDMQGLCAQWWIPDGSARLVPEGIAELLELAQEVLRAKLLAEIVSRGVRDLRVGSGMSLMLDDGARR